MKLILKLYVIGNTPNSMRAINNLNKICKSSEFDEDMFDIDIIDVLKNPTLAEEDKIVAVPTLVKKLPVPMQKIVGDLADHDKVLLGLNLLELNIKEKSDDHIKKNI